MGIMSLFIIYLLWLLNASNIIQRLNAFHVVQKKRNITIIVEKYYGDRNTQVTIDQKI